MSPEREDIPEEAQAPEEEGPMVVKPDGYTSGIETQAGYREVPADPARDLSTGASGPDDVGTGVGDARRRPEGDIGRPGSPTDRLWAYERATGGDEQADEPVGPPSSH